MGKVSATAEDTPEMTSAVKIAQEALLRKSLRLFSVSPSQTILFFFFIATPNRIQTAKIPSVPAKTVVCQSNALRKCLARFSRRSSKIPLETKKTTAELLIQREIKLKFVVVGRPRSDQTDKHAQCLPDHFANSI
jgi:hypothetical protein